MSRHFLDAKHYISPETLSLERKNLFSRLWIFAGFKSQVRERNQFFTRKVAGMPILIQRTDAGIRAFMNECPHRLSAIQIEPCGKRPLVCPYHAWSFGPEGELRGIPKQELYQFTTAEKEEICLHKLHVEEIGELLFVNLSNHPIALEDQFTPDYLKDLREASSHLDSQIIYSCHQVRYNWKLNMENVKDYNHVPFVHPKTFLPAMDAHSGKLAASPAPLFPSLKEQLKQQAAELPHLSFPVKAPLKPYKNWFSDLCDAYGNEHAYYNWFIYPNVNFCSVRGEHFLLQQYDPVSPDITDYHLWVMTACRKNNRTDFTALLSSLIRSERMVIEEDTIILEKLQEGLGDHARPFMHGDYEGHLVRQHEWYLANVLGASK